MLALLGRAHRAPRSMVRRSFRPELEQLEDRLCPSGTEMLSLNAQYQPNKEVTLQGQLTSSSGPLANQTINLGGVVNATATTNAQGGYSITLPVSQLGQVTAASADGQSNTATTTLVSGAPEISNFSAVPEGGGLWWFSGKVTGAPYSGEVVNLDGINALAGKTCTVDSNGLFSYYCYVPSGQGGLAVAEAVDWWGDTSDQAQAAVVC